MKKANSKKWVKAARKVSRGRNPVTGEAIKIKIPVRSISSRLSWSRDKVLKNLAKAYAPRYSRG